MALFRTHTRSITLLIRFLGRRRNDSSQPLQGRPSWARSLQKRERERELCCRPLLPASRSGGYGTDLDNRPASMSPATASYMQQRGGVPTNTEYGRRVSSLSTGSDIRLIRTINKVGG